MKFYVLNDDVLCFTQDENIKGRTMVIEKKRSIKIDTSCLKLLKKSCSWYGNTYNMQRQFVIDKFNYYIKTPIIVSHFDMLIYFPTTSPSSSNCIWISYNNIDRYVKEKDYTKIYFKNGKVLNVSASYATIDNQITKCIKIEKYLYKNVAPTV